MALHTHQRHSYIMTVLAMAIGLCCVNQNALAGKTQHQPPNILFIYLDDLGYGDIASCNPESKIRTANIDRLAREGISFTDAHTAAAICGPSRYGLMTGRYPWRRGQGGTYNGPKFRDVFIEQGRTTVASLLKNSGYNTAQMGKWGLRHNYSQAVKDGEKPGFLESYDFPGKRLLGSQLVGFNYSWCMTHIADKGATKHLFENGLPVDPELKVSDPYRWLPDSAMKVVEYLETYAGERAYAKFGIDPSKPFLVYWDPPSPHEPIVPNEEFVGKSGAGQYGDFVLEIDHYVGKMLDALDRLNLSSDTLVVFSSDNGPERYCYERIQTHQHYSMGPLRGAKRDAWEGGHRVPLFVRWPGVIKPESHCDELVCMTDWLATFAEITNQTLPNNAGEDSASILKLLEGQAIDKPVRESVIHHTPRSRFAIRHKEWLLVDHSTGDASGEPDWFRQERRVVPHDFDVELFNLKSDPQQTRNVSDQYPEKVDELKTLLAQCKNSDEDSAAETRPLILDMVHHNLGRERYDTRYNNPAVIKEMGYNGKVYFLFDSPTLAINWESVDPEILPAGSEDREWVETRAAWIRKQHARCREIGLSAYAMADFILFPKRLIEKHGIEKTFGDFRHPLTQEFLLAQINEVFDQFPGFDGLVVRIGETYLHDAPYHKGKFRDKKNMEESVIPLIQLLREEICVKRNKHLVFRSWNSFDIDLELYHQVNEGVEPHPNLVFSVKHCEGDFNRANPISKVIGVGRHRQIIEVQCSREYEGKGAYPNYVAHGVIEGFEEHAGLPEAKISSIGEFARAKPELFAGIWTWTRGGGWDGPFIKNEMWSDLNAWVMAQWARDPSQGEESVFNRYATERLKLEGGNVKKFRTLCLLSAKAIVRGRNSTHCDMPYTFWTRDEGIGWPGVRETQEAQARNLSQKDESIKIWEEVVQLAESIQWSDETQRRHAVSSALYGLRLFEIYRTLIYMADAEVKGDTAGLRRWISEYDDAWDTYKRLPKQHPEISTLYNQQYSRHIREHAHTKVTALRKTLESPSK